MNIMKTNMLLLDNRIRKDDAGNTTTISAPVPSTIEPQAGMKALMFQGMKNLMENPDLAQEVGVNNDGAKSEDKKSAKSYVAPYSSNIAFQGGNKFKVLSVAALTLLGAAGLASCDDKEYIGLPPAEVTTTVTVNTSNEATAAAIAGLQSILLQMYSQQLISSEQFAQYMKDTEQWRNQMSEKVDGMQAKLDAMYSVLYSMGEKIIDIENGVQENNVYQQMTISLLTQYGYSIEEAKQILREGNDIAKQNGKTVADGMAYIINKLDDIHKDLGTIIEKLDQAAKQREDQKTILLNMQLTGEATKEQVDAILNSVKETNNILKEFAQDALSKLDEVGNNVTDAISYLAQKYGCTSAEIIKRLDMIGIKVDYNTYAQYSSTSYLSQQLNQAISAIDNQTTEIENLRNDYNSNYTDARGLATEALETLNKGIEIIEHIDSTLSSFVSDWANSTAAFNAKIDALSNDVRNILKESKFQSWQLAQLRGDVNTLRVELNKKLAYLRAMYEKMQNDPSSLTKQDIEEIAMRLNGNLQASLGEIAGLVRTEISVEEKQSTQLENIEKKLDNLGSISNSILAELEDVDLSGLDSLGDKIDALIDALNKLSAKIDSYAKDFLDSHNEVVKILRNIEGDVDNILAKAPEFLSELKKANAQLTQADAKLQLLINLVKQIEAKMGRPITPEELDSILAKHDKGNQEFYANLVKSSQVQPVDFSTVLEYLDALKGVVIDGQIQTNKNLATLIELVSKNPELADKIIAAIKDHKVKVVVELKDDATQNNQVTEGYIHIIE